MSSGLEAFDRYLEDVATGARVAGRLERLAVERHLRDLELGPARGLLFDRARAAYAIDWFGLLKHSKGEWAGSPIHLEPWQAFATGSVFGWIRADGRRRFRIAYHELARKNGKSTIAAGIGLLLFVGDGEPGAEVYTAATKRDQARIVHAEAVRMVRACPELGSLVVSVKDNLHVPGTASKYEPLGADADTLDGLNVFGAIVDELHAHRSRDLWDVLETATGARRSPLLYAITTAGTERESVCGYLHEYSIEILEQKLEDDSHFAFVCTLDEGDDWTDPAVWPKANPNLGVSLKIEDLAEKCERAKANLGAQAAFKRLHLNVWTSAVTTFLEVEAWDACAGELDAGELEAALAGREVYAGVDLASTIDLAALALLARPRAEGAPWSGFDLLVRFYMPRDVALDPEKSRRDRVPYPAWVEAGWITATPGNVIDYQFIKDDLRALSERLSILQVGFDPWNATQFAVEVESELGLPMVPVRQGYATLNAPTKELAKLVTARKLRHGGNPVLRWQAANLEVRADPAGNLKPDRGSRRRKIDGMVATIIALDRALRNEGSPFAGSVYSTGGLLAL